MIEGVSTCCNNGMTCFANTIAIATNRRTISSGRTVFSVLAFEETLSPKPRHSWLQAPPGSAEGCL
eukprot:scaffold678148_cov55-Prasinocladus_malaysianus.AAC.2